MRFVKQLRNGKSVVRVITDEASGKRIRQQFQLNRSAKNVCWQRYHLPVNGDKSLAVKINDQLTLKEVLTIISKTI